MTASHSEISVFDLMRDEHSTPVIKPEPKGGRRRKPLSKLMQELGAIDPNDRLVSAMADMQPTHGLPDIPRGDPLAQFWKMNDELVAAGWPDLSPWWRNAITEAYAAGVPSIVIRGGRRGGKSTSVCRVAVFETVWGDHVVPPGDVGWFAIISAERGQAKERLDTCAKMLDALGIDHKPTAERIVITDTRPEYDQATRRGIRTFTASLRGVVSFTAIGALCDEEARWRDDDTGANPATAVLSSLTPTMASMPNAKVWHVSSPWSTLDAHHALVELGNTTSQRVFTGSTWEMNPTISEKRTHELEPDELSWQREYAGIPMPSDETKFFNAAAIDAARKAKVDYRIPTRVVAGGDFAFRRDASTVTVMEMHDDRMRLVYDHELTPRPGHPLVPGIAIAHHCQQAQSRGADAIACDLHYIESVREVIDNDFDLELLEFPSGNDGIAKAYVALRVALSSGRLDLSMASERTIDQLKNTTCTPGDGATLLIKNKRTLGAHGDLVSSLVCASWASTRTPVEDKASFGARRFARGEDIDAGAVGQWQEHSSEVTD